MIVTGLLFLSSLGQVGIDTFPTLVFCLLIFLIPEIIIYSKKSKLKNVENSLKIAKFYNNYHVDFIADKLNKNSSEIKNAIGKSIFKNTICNVHLDSLKNEIILEDFNLYSSEKTEYHTQPSAPNVLQYATTAELILK